MANARTLTIPGTSGGSYELNDYRIHIYSSVTGTSQTGSPKNCAFLSITDTETSGQSLSNDMIICFKNPINIGDLGACVNLNNTGNHPIVYKTTTLVTDKYTTGTMIWAIYDSGSSASVYINNTVTSISGCWVVMTSPPDTPNDTDIMLISYNPTSGTYSYQQDYFGGCVETHYSNDVLEVGSPNFCPYRAHAVFEYDTSTGNPLTIAVNAIHNGGELYLWIANTSSADLTIVIDSVLYAYDLFDTYQITDIYIPEDGITVSKDHIVEIGMYCSSELHGTIQNGIYYSKPTAIYITSRNDLVVLT